ncbi:hypothetical protein CMI37_34455 [Candidatus Pacearchaeota archaeon]|nr:hypothetical protein [Candidatus Pacearchaeota archaeon]
MKNKDKILTMLDEIESMLPKPEEVLEGSDPWMVLSMISLRDAVDPRNKDGTVNEGTAAAHALRPDLARKTSLKIVEDMIFAADKEDQSHKKKMILKGKGEKAIGESWMVFHLKTIRSLIIDE